MQGLYDGIAKAKKLVKEDISYIYGMMCVKLIEKGWTVEECSELIEDIQTTWADVTQSGTTMKEYLNDNLDIEIVQTLGGQ